MIGRNKLPELRKFAQAETELPLRTDPEFATLVVPNGNGAAAVHRWFKYKEAFSSELVGHVLQKLAAHYTPEARMRLLDPFCGVGTSLLSAQLLDREIDAVGIECNPFSAFVARTKLAWHRMDSATIRAHAQMLLTISDERPVKLPALSSITSTRCITRHMASQIMAFRRAIEALPTSVERDALMLGLAASIEPVSRVRRDGRALRIVEKPRTSFRKVLSSRWAMIADDVEMLQRRTNRPRHAAIHEGDGRNLTGVNIKDDSFDLILTSPPYPNNIDYNEIYKLELWFLGYAHSSEQFLDLRRATFRSHPTCKPLTNGDCDEEFESIVERGRFAELMGMVIRRVASLENQNRRGRSKVLLGYIYDTWQSLRSHYKALRLGGHAVYVVGNSLHGGTDKPYLIPTDLIIATLAEEVGFDVQEIVIARGLQRRLAGNHFLRDSVIILRKN